MPGFNIPVFKNGCFQQVSDSKFQGGSITAETARQNRFVLESLGDATPQYNAVGSLLLYAHNATRPKVSFDKITIHNGQDEIFRPGKHHWSDVTLTFYEVLQTGDPNAFVPQQSFNKTADMIYHWWAEVMMDIRTSYFKPQKDYLKQCKLSMLDGVGSPIWSYNLYDCWPCEVTPSDASFLSSEISTITMTLRYDKAVEDYTNRPKPS